MVCNDKLPQWDCKETLRWLVNESFETGWWIFLSFTVSVWQCANVWPCLLGWIATVSLSADLDRAEQMRWFRSKALSWLSSLHLAAQSKYYQWKRMMEQNYSVGASASCWKTITAERDCRLEEIKCFVKETKCMWEKRVILSAFFFEIPLYKSISLISQSPLHFLLSSLVNPQHPNLPSFWTKRMFSMSPIMEGV